MTKSITNRSERTRLDIFEPPTDVARKFGDRRRLAVLIGRWHAGDAVIAWDPTREATGDPFSAIDDLPHVDAGTPGFGGGWIGAWGYRLARRLTRHLGPVPLASERPCPQPEYRLAFYEHVLRYAHGQWWLESLPGTGNHAAVLSDVRATLNRPIGEAAYTVGQFRAYHGDIGHREAVVNAVTRIQSGGAGPTPGGTAPVVQVNLALRLQAQLTGDPLDVFCRGVAELAPAYGAYIADASGAIMSMSPELFLRQNGRDVLTSPIKGTADLASDPANLIASAKDNAENAIGTDLLRNDLNRVCVPGSVRVSSRARLERHAVWHLVSDVAGRLRPEVSAGELLASSFPPGSVTGAPKAQALECIGQLESTSRETYTGAIGYISPLAGMELSVAIRTFETDGSRIWLGVGGGIGVQSDPDAELAECWVKARPLIRAISDADTNPEPAQAANPAGGSAVGPHGGNDLAVFETIRVHNGQPLNLEAHVSRLEMSVRSVYSFGLPADTRQRITSKAGGLAGTHRLRADITMQADDVHLTVTHQPIADAGWQGQPWELVPYEVSGGLGAHKWADRHRVDVPLDDGSELLLMDVDGSVLEGGRSSVFVVDERGIHTPLLDGRILPGTMRAQIIDIAHSAGMAVRQRRLTLGDVRSADEVFMTNAVRGIVPVSRIRGLGEWATGPVTGWISTELAHRVDQTAPQHAAIAQQRPDAATAPVTVAIIHDNDPWLYNLAASVQALGALIRSLDTQSIDVSDVMQACRSGELTHVIVTTSAPHRTSAAQHVLREAVASAVPVLGVGDGLTAVAQAWGVSIQAVRPVRHGEAADVSHDGFGVFQRIPSPMTVGVYHCRASEPPVFGSAELGENHDKLDVVSPKPLADEFDVTARCSAGSVVGIRHRSLPLEAVQFRPDSFLTPSGPEIFANFLAISPNN